MAETSEAELVEISGENRMLAASLKVIPDIHRDDLIFQFVEQQLWKGDREKAVRNYYQLGLHSSTMAREFIGDVARVQERGRRDWRPSKILDFAAGFGNATRHLKNVFPESVVTSCDIHDKAIDFHKHVLGIDCYMSSFTPENIQLPQQDVIVVMSLFSHLPKRTFARWIGALGNSLAPGGALIFTANGFVSDRRGNFGIPVDDTGFGFRPKSEQHDLPGDEYGLTISYPEFVTQAISECPELRLSALREGYWWSMQDTYVCIRR